MKPFEEWLAMLSTVDNQIVRAFWINGWNDEGIFELMLQFGNGNHTIKWTVPFFFKTSVKMRAMKLSINSDARVQF